MKRMMMPIVAALLLALLGCSLPGAANQPAGAPAGMGEYTRFMPKTDSELRAAVSAGDVSPDYVIAKTVAGFDRANFSRLGFEVAGNFDLNGSSFFRLKAMDKTIKRLATLSRTGGIVYAEHELISSIPVLRATDADSARGAPEIKSVLNDPLTWGAFGHFETTRAIDAYRDLGFGSSMVYVADIDTGINRLHEDFIDADGRQIVARAMSAFASPDHGRTFSYVGTGNPFVEVPVNENWDDYAHGSHTAGTIAALGNNGKGVAGVAWKNVRLLSYKGLLNNSGNSWSIYGSFKDLVDWKKSNGIAQTIPVNMSLGGAYASLFALEMVNYALANGCVIIASMGNDGAVKAFYPAAYAGIIAVGATRGNGEKVHFSTMGKHISVMAPGYNILSTASNRTIPTDQAFYEDKSGTSMAAPFVTGLVAYMLTFNPTLTLDQIKTILEQTATNMGPAGWDQDTGYGQVDVKAAVARVKSGDIPAPGSVYCSTKIGVSVYNTNAFYNSGIPEYPDAVVGQSVYLYGADGKFVTLGVTNAVDGSTEFRNLKPGSYKASVNYLGQMREMSVTLDNSSDKKIDFFFDITLLWLQTVPNGAVAGAEADTVLTLFDAVGNVIAGPYDFGGLDSFAVAGLASGATYYLRITPWNDVAFGEYGLKVGFARVDSVNTLNGRGTPPGSDDLFEPNDTSFVPTAITLGNDYGQYLGNYDWFVFRMP